MIAAYFFFHLHLESFLFIIIFRILVEKQAQMGSLRKFQRQLVDRFRRSFRVDAKNTGSVKMGNPAGVTTS